METNRRLGSSVKRHEAIGTVHYERGSPVGICNARFSFRGSDVSRRPTVHRPINEQCVYTGRRKDRLNAALRSLFAIWTRCARCRQGRVDGDGSG
jgi:hypothetical protein